ncbi:hypothetical protein BDZ89DRAFT_1146051 [Hymenopellis radicata]|nr:hypothetical protein BDZ89DRAFT_1146051 [Hymenopellis radicata]
MADKTGVPVLPSIQDMFPDHLLRLPLQGSSTRPSCYPSNGYHDCHCSHSSSSSRPRPPPPFQIGHPYPSVNRSIKSGSSRSSSCSDGEDDEVTPGDERKHTCKLCAKKFNRPSSLRIHMNTHTGATPFRCPFPGCGRSFNVNSNMRRHFRNHRSAHPPEALYQDPLGERYTGVDLFTPHPDPGRAQLYSPPPSHVLEPYPSAHDRYLQRPGWRRATWDARNAETRQLT